MFEQLGRKEIGQIIDIELAAFRRRLDELGFELRLTAEAKDFLADKGYDPAYGARPLKRAIQTYLEDVLAEMLLTTVSRTGKEVMVVDKADGGDNLCAHIEVAETVPDAALPEA